VRLSCVTSGTREALLLTSHIEFASKHRILRARAKGCVTDADLREYYAEGFQWVARLKPLAVINDMSAVTSLEVSLDTIAELAKLKPIIPDPGTPRVIIATSPQVFGMARMFQMRGESTRPSLHAVRTEDEAFAILGILEPRFESVQRE
jgi:hypothetical protein